MKDIVVPILSTTYKILSNILIPYAKETVGDHQHGFQCNRPTTDRIFCICKILGTKLEYEAVYWLFLDFKKAYESVRSEVLYTILTEFGIPMKLES
jgi:sorting nexin-29